MTVAPIMPTDIYTAPSFTGPVKVHAGDDGAHTDQDSNHRYGYDHLKYAYRPPAEWVTREGARARG